MRVLRNHRSRKQNVEHDENGIAAIQKTFCPLFSLRNENSTISLALGRCIIRSQLASIWAEAVFPERPANRQLRLPTEWLNFSVADDTPTIMPSG